MGLGLGLGSVQAGRLRALLQPLRALASHAALRGEQRGRHLLRVRVRGRRRVRGRVGIRVTHCEARGPA